MELPINPRLHWLIAYKKRIINHFNQKKLEVCIQVNRGFNYQNHYKRKFVRGDRGSLGLVLSGIGHRHNRRHPIRVLRGHGLQHVPEPTEASPGRTEKETRRETSFLVRLRNHALME